jgi:hypothetical protein
MCYIELNQRRRLRKGEGWGHRRHLLACPKLSTLCIDDSRRREQVQAGTPSKQKRARNMPFKCVENCYHTPALASQGQLLPAALSRRKRRLPRYCCCCLHQAHSPAASAFVHKVQLLPICSAKHGSSRCCVFRALTTISCLKSRARVLNSRIYDVSERRTPYSTSAGMCLCWVTDVTRRVDSRWGAGRVGSGGSSLDTVRLPDAEGLHALQGFWLITSPFRCIFFKLTCRHHASARP